MEIEDQIIQKADLADINLEEFITHFKVQGNIKNIKREITVAASVVRSTAIHVGPRPVWGALEIRLTDWIKEMHADRKTVTCILVLRKALEFDPSFMGGALDAEFSKKGMNFNEVVL